MVPGSDDVQDLWVLLKTAHRTLPVLEGDLSRLLRILTCVTSNSLRQNSDLDIKALYDAASQNLLIDVEVTCVGCFNENEEEC